MGRRLKKLKKIRLHREGTNTLIWSMVGIIIVALLLYKIFDNKIPLYGFLVVFGTLYAIVLNFFRCPIRYYNDDTEKIVIAPADGKIVVIEEVQENEYFHDKRLMISIFMSVFNVHANWFPVDGKVKMVKHQNGNYHKAWLPKDSEECYIDEHLGFIKFGSRVDVYLPIGSEVCVKMGQSTTGDQTVLAKLK